MNNIYGKPLKLSSNVEDMIKNPPNELESCKCGVETSSGLIGGLCRGCRNAYRAEIQRIRYAMNVSGMEAAKIMARRVRRKYLTIGV